MLRTGFTVIICENHAPHNGRKMAMPLVICDQVPPRARRHEHTGAPIHRLDWLGASLKNVILNEA